MTDYTDLIARLRAMPAKARLGGSYESDCKDAADALEAKDRRIAELEQWRDDMPARAAQRMLIEQHDKINAHDARITELKAALEPLMKISLLHVRPEVANAIRAARDAYLGEKE